MKPFYSTKLVALLPAFCIATSFACADTPQRPPNIVIIYDLDADPGQKNNLAAQHPDVLRQMLAYAEQAREELGDDLTNRIGKGRREPGRLPNTNEAVSAKNGFTTYAARP
jgi:hypothetical protein